MFTGIIEELGRVKNISHGTDSAVITIEASLILEGLKLGDSIAVNGVCLTAVQFGSDFFKADVMSETLSRSNLGKLSLGAKVNLERALALKDRLGGHLVSGHIDGVGKILKIEKKDIALLYTILAPDKVLKYVIEKGSVAIDGISLTVVSFDKDSFKVSLIPHTAKLTTLGYKKVGDEVNLEGDIIGKYVEKMLGKEESHSNSKEGLKLSDLIENGFL